MTGVELLSAIIPALNWVPRTSQEVFGEVFSSLFEVTFKDIFKNLYLSWNLVKVLFL